MKQPIIAIDASLVSTRNTGDTSYWRGLIWGLSQLNTKSQIYLISSAPPAESGDLPNNFFWHKIPANNPRFWSLSAFPKAAEQLGADLLHTQYNISPLTKIKSITTIHDVSFFINPKWYGFKDRVLLTRQIPNTISRANRIFTVSNTSKAEIERHIPAAIGKTTVTYNALRSDFPTLSKVEARNILTQHKYNLAEPFILAPTSNWARKNSSLAARAHENSAANQTHQLVTYGPGESLAPTSLHLGYVPDKVIPALYAAADLFILPSLHEGFGIPILEAFASRTPLLTGPGGAIPEIAADAAHICPDYSPTTWGNALTELLADSGKLVAMVKRGEKRVQDFSWIKTAEITMQAYEEVTNG